MNTSSSLLTIDDHTYSFSPRPTRSKNQKTNQISTASKKLVFSAASNKVLINQPEAASELKNTTNKKFLKRCRSRRGKHKEPKEERTSGKRKSRWWKFMSYNWALLNSGVLTDIVVGYRVHNKLFYWNLRQILRDAWRELNSSWNYSVCFSYREFSKFRTVQFISVRNFFLMRCGVWQCSWFYRISCLGVGLVFLRWESNKYK